MPDESNPGAPAPAPSGGTLLGADVGASAAAPVTGVAAAAPVQPATPASAVMPDGTFAAGWLDTLPEAIRGNPSLATVPSLSALAESYIHTKGMVGKKFQAPSESSTPEEIAAWRKNVGAPETPEGYGELRPNDFPEDQWDKETAGQFAALAHKHHLPAGAVKEIIGFHASQVKAGLEKFKGEDEASFQAEMTSLKQAWGADFAANAHAAQTFAKALGLDPLTDPVFRNAGVVQAMARGAKLIMGDKLVQGAPGSIAGGIESRISDIRRSPEYLGERGESAQKAAQDQLHSLMNAQKAA